MTDTAIASVPAHSLPRENRFSLCSCPSLRIVMRRPARIRRTQFFWATALRLPVPLGSPAVPGYCPHTALIRARCVGTPDLAVLRQMLRRCALGHAATQQVTLEGVRRVVFEFLFPMALLVLWRHRQPLSAMPLAVTGSSSPACDLSLGGGASDK